MSQGLMMRHRSPPKSGPPTHIETNDVEGQNMDWHDLYDLQSSRKGRSRQKADSSLRLFVFVAVGLCAFLYSIDILMKDHARVALTPSAPSPPSSPSSDSSVISSLSENNSHRRNSDRSITECGIWMAPSSLRPNPGFGIFTTRDIAHEESILHQPDAVSIPLHDMRRREDMPLWEERRNLWVNVFGNVSGGDLASRIQYFGNLINLVSRFSFHGKVW
jgi:hypothetical protein